MPETSLLFAGSILELYVCNPLLNVNYRLALLQICWRCMCSQSNCKLCLSKLLHENHLMQRLSPKVQLEVSHFPLEIILFYYSNSNLSSTHFCTFLPCFSPGHTLLLIAIVCICRWGQMTFSSWGGQGTKINTNGHNWFRKSYCFTQLG